MEKKVGPGFARDGWSKWFGCNDYLGIFGGQVDGVGTDRADRDDSEVGCVRLRERGDQTLRGEGLTKRPVRAGGVEFQLSSLGRAW